MRVLIAGTARRAGHRPTYCADALIGRLIELHTVQKRYDCGRCSACVHRTRQSIEIAGQYEPSVPNLRWVNTRQPKSTYAGRPIELCTGVRTMNERNIHLAKLLGPLAVIGAIVGYLREASFSGMLAGAIFFLVLGGIVGLLITDSRSPAK